jgi:hypothetical protein
MNNVVCKICGAPTDSILLRCERCAESLFWMEEIRYTSEWLRAHPDTRIELVKDAKKVIHLAMFRFPAQAWCLKKLPQKRENRTTTPAGTFPPGCCPACLLVYEGMGL